MRKTLALPVLFLVACSTTGQISRIQEKSLAINPGMTTAAVAQSLGVPGNRSFSGDREAWQYCSTGFSTDKYITIWFEDGLVHGLTTFDGFLVGGYCSQKFPAIDWGQFPYNQKIKLDVTAKEAE